MTSELQRKEVKLVTWWGQLLGCTRNKLKEAAVPSVTAFTNSLDSPCRLQINGATKRHQLILEKWKYGDIPFERNSPTYYEMQ